jgi:hypothetical protein
MGGSQPAALADVAEAVDGCRAARAGYSADIGGARPPSPAELFKSAGQAQRFLSAHDQINDLFHLRRDHVTAAEHRTRRSQTFQVWAESPAWVGTKFLMHTASPLLSS